MSNTTENTSLVSVIFGSTDFVELSMPQAAIEDCSSIGDRYEDCVYWSRRVERPASLTESRLAAMLKETGGWSAEELENDAENWIRAVWIAACDERERQLRELAENAE